MLALKNRKPQLKKKPDKKDVLGQSNWRVFIFFDRREHTHENSGRIRLKSQEKYFQSFFFLYLREQKFLGVAPAISPPRKQRLSHNVQIWLGPGELSLADLKIGSLHSLKGPPKWSSFDKSTFRVADGQLNWSHPSTMGVINDFFPTATFLDDDLFFSSFIHGKGLFRFALQRREKNSFCTHKLHGVRIMEKVESRRSRRPPNYGRLTHNFIVIRFSGSKSEF